MEGIEMDVYLSPERLSGEDNYDEALSDVYSYGMILFEILTREKPFSKTLPILPPPIAFAKIKEMVQNGQRPEFPRNIKIKSKLKKLINDCWSSLPRNRPTFDTIYSLLTKKSSYQLDKIDKHKYEMYIKKINEAK